jgi:PAS domain S-box-containing protein
LDNHFFLRSPNRTFDMNHVVNLITDGVAIFAADGSCLYANQPLTDQLNPPSISALSSINLFTLIEDEKLIDDILITTRQGRIWNGSHQVRFSNNLYLIVTMIASLDPHCNQFIAYFLPLGKPSFGLGIWDQLRDSEERYRSLVELSPNSIQVQVNGIITFINTSGVKALRGASAEEFIGQPILKFIHPKDHDYVITRMAREIEFGEKTGPVEECWVRADGSEFDVEVVALPFEYRGQTAVQVIAIDITERKQAREQLRQYTRQLLALNAIGLALVSSFNTDEIIKQITISLTGILHATSLSIMLRQGNELAVVASVGEEDSELSTLRVPFSQVEEFLNSSSREPHLISGEDLGGYSLALPDKQQTILLAPVIHNEDIIGVLQAAYQDTAEQMAAEKDILKSVSNWVSVALQNSKLYQNERRQHEFAEGLLESASAINSNLDLPQVLERILQQVWRVIPCSAANIMTIRNQEVYVFCSLGYEQFGIDPDWLNSVHFPIDKLPYLHQIQENRKPVITRNIPEDPYWVTVAQNDWIRSYVAAPLIVKDRVYGFINLDSDKVDYFSEDTTQRLQAFANQASIAIQNAKLFEDLQDALHHEQAIRAQLVQSEKLVSMGRMVASVAHELNNPLQTIRNCLFILQKEANIDSELSAYLSTGLEEVERLSGIVEQLREAYRPSIQNQKTVINVVDLLENIYGLMKPHIQHKNIQWVVTGEKDCFILAHADTMKQVFINLVHNAVEAMDPYGGELQIEVVTHPHEEKAEICFHDSGKGIEPEDLANIFDPFYTTRETGFGLGLAICRDIVENHGGHIEVASQPGHGSTFSVWLPKAAGE